MSEKVKKEKGEKTKVMGKYGALYEASKSNKQVTQLSSQYVKFIKEGDMVVGKFMSLYHIPKHPGGGDYNQYVFQTDDGLIKFAMGQVNDNEAGALMQIGSVYAVRFMGGVEISGGRTVNTFDIQELHTGKESKVGGVNDSAW